MLAIIGGRGLSELANLEITHRQVMRTPFGEPSGAFLFGTLNQRDVIFLARHGYGHTIPPHIVNYRANLWALREQGVNEIVSVATVGGIRADLSPGTLVVPDQIIDYTHDRDGTYFNSRNSSYKNIDFTLPYSPKMRKRILDSAQELQIRCADGGCYAATQGPRLDTIAEINRYRRDGADMVGMTGMPETALARELNMHYASIAVVVNYAAGCGESWERISLDGVTEATKIAMASVRAILECVVNCSGSDENDE